MIRAVKPKPPARKWRTKHEVRVFYRGLWNLTIRKHAQVIEPQGRGLAVANPERDVIEYEDLAIGGKDSMLAHDLRHYYVWLKLSDVEGVDDAPQAS